MFTQNYCSTTERESQQTNCDVLRDLLNFVRGAELTDKFSAQTKCVLIAYIRRDLRANGRTSFNASVRDIAEISFTSKTTVSKVTKRLVQRGILKQFVRTDKRSATEYELVPDKIKSSIKTGHISKYYMFTNDTENFETHITFSRFGLGPRAIQIWNVMLSSADPLTAEQISKESKVSRMTTFRKLSKMKDYGMVLHNADKTYSPIVDVDLDRIARTFGIDDKFFSFKRQHDIDRAKWLKQE